MSLRDAVSCDGLLGFTGRLLARASPIADLVVATATATTFAVIITFVVLAIITFVVLAIITFVIALIILTIITFVILAIITFVILIVLVTILLLFLPIIFSGSDETDDNYDENGKTENSFLDVFKKNN